MRRASLAAAALGVSCLAVCYGCGSAQDNQSVGETHESVWFSEESKQRGVEFVHVSGHREKHLLPEITGSGVALIDVNSDGWLDIYFVQSGSLTQVEANDPYVNELYINQRDGTFAKRAPETSAADAGYGMGVAAGDYDNDGDSDLYVTNVGRNRLYNNDGTGMFVPAKSEVLADDNWGTSAAFLDLDRDGDLDLYHANYLHWSVQVELDCYSSGVLTYCPPVNYRAPSIDRLYRNNGDGTFTDITYDAGIDAAFGNGFGVIGADYDNNGYIDVFVANDLTVNQLWMNQGDLDFLDESMTRGSGVDGFGIAKAGMGVVSADPDRDGDYDILVVNLTGESDSYFRNEGTHFTDSTSEVGLSAPSRKYTRFGVVLADFDNDGWLDLYHANGGVSPVDLSASDVYAEPNVLFRGTQDGHFVEVSPQGGTERPLVHTSRGLAVGDIDNDGGLDLVVVNRDAQAYVLMNRYPNRGNWISFAIETSRGGIANGALVTLTSNGRQIYGTVRPEGSYLSSNDPRVHFGLGSVLTVEDVRVMWTTGDVEEFGAFEAGQVVELRQGQGNPSEWPRLP